MRNVLVLVLLLAVGFGITELVVSYFETSHITPQHRMV
jgi:hypothetical protein